MLDAFSMAEFKEMKIYLYSTQIILRIHECRLQIELSTLLHSAADKQREAGSYLRNKFQNMSVFCRDRVIEM